MPAINIVIITFMMCVVISPEKFAMIFILALITLLFSAPLGTQKKSSFIVLRVDMMILFILCSSHTMAVSRVISIFMLNECASIPITLYQKVKYPLHLFLSFPIISETATLFRPICAKVVPTSGCWLFYNHEHDYLCHFNCAAVSEYGTENHSMGKLQNRLQTLATTNRPPTTLAGRPSGNFTHFSHRHALKEYNSGKPLDCSLCGIDYLIGYFCSSCNYFIDKICFSAPSMIQHMSHPQHPLKLTCYLDYKNENINCPACQVGFRSGRTRAYYCAPCKFIMNRQCAGAPKNLTLADNVSYELFSEFPFKNENAGIKCNICSKRVVTKGGLLYYNLEHDKALHVCCALTKESDNNEMKMNRLSIQRLNKVRIAE